MPIDPVFRSDWKPHASRRTVRADHRAIQPGESVERQLGRSDALLGEIRCPFEPGADALEWQAGFDAEKASWIPLEVQAKREKAEKKLLTRARAERNRSGIRRERHS